MKHIVYRLIPSLFFLAVLSTGCQEKNAVAPGPVSDLKAVPGRNAARLEFRVPADAKTGKIFHSQGAFETFIVSDPGAIQTVLVRGLSEGENLLRVVTRNAAGVLSDPRGVKVQVYGDDYLKKLSNRTLMDQKFLSATSTELIFGEAQAGEVELRILFTNSAGAKDSLIVGTGQTTVLVDGIDLGKDYSFCSVFKPVEEFIGEYVTGKVSIPDFFRKKLWKNIWKIDSFSGEDVQKPAVNLIDNAVNTIWRPESASGPHWIVVDMLSLKQYDGFVLEQAQETTDGAGFSKNYRFEAGNNGSEWEVIKEGRFKAHGYRQKVAFDRSVQSRYFRITVLDSYDDALAQLAEIDLYNDSETSGENGLELPMLVNAQPPFQGDGSDRFPAVGAGRMQRLTGWTHNDAAYISHDTAVGSFNIFSAAVWGCSDVTNGKIYQTLNLLPGKYALNIDMGNSSHRSCADAFVVIAKGKALPDYPNVAAAAEVLGIGDLMQHLQSRFKVPFTLEEAAEVTVGVVYNTYNVYAATGIVWSDLNINSFALQGN